MPVGEIQDPQTSVIQAAEEALIQKDWELAEKRFREFLEGNSVSVYWVQAKYGLGQSLEGLNRCQEAIEHYREITRAARTLAPDRVGLSYLRMSYCYERLGDELRLRGALSDAETLSAHLPYVVRDLELPARWAASYLRMRDFDQAKVYLRRLDSTLPAAVGERAGEESKAQALLSVGQLSLQALSEDNFLEMVRTHAVLQKYLWQAITMHVDGLSLQASDDLSTRFESFLKWASDWRDPSERKTKETRGLWMAEIKKALDQLRELAGEDWKTSPPSLVATANRVDQVTQENLWSFSETTPLTPESKNRKKQKRAGKVIAEPFFPKEREGSRIEKQKDAVQNGQDSDPNLAK